MSESRISTPRSTASAGSPARTPTAQLMARRARPRAPSGAFERPASPASGSAGTMPDWDALVADLEAHREVRIAYEDTKLRALAVVRLADGTRDIELFVPRVLARGTMLGEWRVKSAQPFTLQRVEGTLCVVSDPHPPLTVDTSVPDRPTVFWPVPSGPIHHNVAPPRLGHKVFDFRDVNGKLLVPVRLDDKAQPLETPGKPRPGPCCR